MGSGSSCLVASVVPLPTSVPEDDGEQILLEKLTSHPALISKPLPGLSLLLCGVAQTWVHVACERRQIQVVQRLLGFLATSPLTVVREALAPYCRRVGLPPPASVLEGVRLAVDMCNGRGQTPLMHACYAGCPELARLLTEKGANVWAADRCGGRTALHYAAIAGCPACVAALIRTAGARQAGRGGGRYVDARSNTGLTPLHYALYYERHDVTRELLRHGPDIAAPTAGAAVDLDPALGGCECGGTTPLHLAAARGNATGVLELLRYYNIRRPATALPDPRLARDAAGQQPWQLAAAAHPVMRQFVLLLHPGQPMPLGLWGGESAQGPGLGAPSLASIAAAALRLKLLASVDEAEAAASAAAAAAAVGGALFDRLALPARSASVNTAASSRRSSITLLTNRTTNASCTSTSSSAKHPPGSESCNEAPMQTQLYPLPHSHIPVPRLPSPLRCQPSPLRRDSAVSTRATPTPVPPAAGGGNVNDADRSSGDSSGAHSQGFYGPLPYQHSAAITDVSGATAGRAASQSPRATLSGARVRYQDAPPPPVPAATPRMASRPASPEQHPFGVQEPHPSVGLTAQALITSSSSPRRTVTPPSPHRIMQQQHQQPHLQQHTQNRDQQQQRQQILSIPWTSMSTTTTTITSETATANVAVGTGGGGQGGGGSSGRRRPLGPAVSSPAALGWRITGQGTPPYTEHATVAAVAGCGTDCGPIAGVEVGEVDDEDMCTVCFARRKTVAPSACGHGVCGACARELCSALALRPLLCPFCRQPVVDFVGLPPPLSVWNRRGRPQVCLSALTAL